MELSILQIEVRWYEGRYHGTGAWPPAPARLFQALIAAVARGKNLPPRTSEALRWLEQQDAPEVRAPRVRQGQRITLYVPNNDLDSVGNDPRRVAEIRDEKKVQPYLFDEDLSVVYLWRFAPEANEHAQHLCQVAEELYQLGRGVDMAWAKSEVLDEAQLTPVTSSGIDVYRPLASGGATWPCPAPGSLQSLIEREQAQSKRFRHDAKKTVLTQAKRGHFVPIGYERVNDPSSVERQVYNLDRPYPLVDAGILAASIRDATLERTANSSFFDASLWERVLKGMGVRGARSLRERVRILPLPSIGHQHADGEIRRILVEVPANCPIPAKDVFWAFTNLNLSRNLESQSFLTLGGNDRMAHHYGIGRSATSWYSVTPVALSAVDRARSGLRKRGSERATYEGQIVWAVQQALRQSEALTPVASVRVQREPFQARGERAETFAPGTRFAPEQLWHVALEFKEPQAGSLVVGDGRFTGLGLFAPQVETKGPLCLGFRLLDGLTPEATEESIASALRRAVMARCGNSGDSVLAFVSGHQKDGIPALGHDHLFYSVDLKRRLALLWSPMTDPSTTKALRENLVGFDDLRAGAAGRLRLGHHSADELCTLIGPSRYWSSITDYVPTRHPRGGTSRKSWVEDDVRHDLAQRYPQPLSVEITSLYEGPRGGLRARISLEFPTPISGPVALGRTAHKGGGFMKPTTPNSDPHPSTSRS